MTSILYVSAVPLGMTSNGGSLVARAHVRRLASLGMDLYICAIGQSPSDKTITDFADEHGARVLSMEFPRKHKYARLLARLSLSSFFLFSYEKIARTHYLDAKFKEAVETVKPDVIVIDYLLTALFVPFAFRSNIPVVLITLNREAEYHRHARRIDYSPVKFLRSVIAGWRLARFEAETYRRSAAVVALTPLDAPKIEGHLVRVIEPTLGVSELRWTPSSDDIFFVGNIVHYPNRAAVKWLCGDFAAALAKIAPGSSIRIVGADSGNVPSGWRKDNVVFLGAGDRQCVERNILSCGLFIAPIENNFGSKMKVLECLSHGTPILATRAALSGVPFAGSVPQFDLARPEEAAEIAVRLLKDKPLLLDLSARLSALYAEMENSRGALWGDLIQKVLDGRPKA